MKSAQGAVDLIALDPIVQIAKGQDEISAARRRDLMVVGVDFGDFHLGETSGFSLNGRESSDDRQDNPAPPTSPLAAM